MEYMEAPGSTFHHYNWGWGGVKIEAKRRKEHSYEEMVYSLRREDQGTTLWNSVFKDTANVEGTARVRRKPIRGGCQDVA